MRNLNFTDLLALEWGVALRMVLCSLLGFKCGNCHIHVTFMTFYFQAWSVP